MNICCNSIETQRNIEIFPYLENAANLEHVIIEIPTLKCLILWNRWNEIRNKLSPTGNEFLFNTDIHRRLDVNFYNSMRVAFISEYILRSTRDWNILKKAWIHSQIASSLLNNFHSSDKDFWNPPFHSRFFEAFGVCHKKITKL